MPRVRIHGFAVSTWTRTALMTCIEKGVDYELVPLKRGSEEHRAMHPFERIPILEVEGERIFETLAISGYLDEAFAGPSLQPADLDERTRMRVWMGICGDYLFRDVVRGIPRGRTPTAAELESAREALSRAQSLFAGGEFLAGGALSLADLYLAPQIANCREKAPQLVAELGSLGAWAEAMDERESAVRTRPDGAARPA